MHYLANNLREPFPRKTTLFSKSKVCIINYNLENQTHLKQTKYTKENYLIADNYKRLSTLNIYILCNPITLGHL